METRGKSKDKSFEIAEYVSERIRLVKLERDAEICEETAASSSSSSLLALEASGVALTRLVLSGTAVDTGGRTILSYATRGGRVLSASKLSTGAIVGVRCMKTPKGVGKTSASGSGPPGESSIPRGVLSKLTDTTVEVVMDDDDLPADISRDSSSQDTFAVVRMGSSATFDRTMIALSDSMTAMESSVHPSRGVLGVLFNGRDARFESESKLVLSEQQRSVLEGLNESQVAAVVHSLRSKDLSVIHGPPGTGKTTTVVAYVAAEVLRGSRVLVVAPSNIAVDNIAEKLDKMRDRMKLRFVRTGHPARVMPSVTRLALDTLVAQTDEAALARDVRKELADLQKSAGARRRERAMIRSERKVLRKELRTREGDALNRLMKNMDCVLATISGAGARVIERAVPSSAFDVVVVDEAGQASEVAALVALLRGKKAVLAGDPFQLAPTVKCVEAEKQGLGRTLLDRVFDNSSLHDQVVKMLDCQYRMNATISDWCSSALYGGRLKSAPEVAKHALLDLPDSGLASATADSCGNDILSDIFCLIDTAGGGMGEAGGRSGSDGETLSWSNNGEAGLVIQHVLTLVKHGVLPSQIGVISPYSGQVSLIRSKLDSRLFADGLEVSTVDSFQGREKEAIVISLVRSNERGSIGFVSDRRRLNVAVSRARRHVCVVADSATVGRDPFISGMIDYVSENGVYTSAEDAGVSVGTAEFVSALSLVAKDEETARKESAATRPSSAPSSSKQARKKTRAERNAKNRKTRESKEPKRSTVPSAESRRAVDARLTSSVEVRGRVVAFVNDIAESTLVLPSSLNAFERKIAHETCEEFGLLHVAQGEGASRHLSISKLSAPGHTQGAGITMDHSNNQSRSPEEQRDDSLAVTSAEEIGLGGRSGGFSVLDEESIDAEENSENSPGVASSESKLEETPVSAQATNVGKVGNEQTPQTNQTLKDLHLARMQRNQDAAAQVPDPARPDLRDEDTLPASTRRIIVDGRLLDAPGSSSTPADKTAAKARLRSKLSDKAKARKSKKKVVS